MPTEKATALVVRTTDWSETSRIATLWTREFGKVRVLAKGGRRLKSSFESALDLLTLCSIVLIRKSSGGLDLLTEAQVLERFPRLSASLATLYGGYYVAELLSDFTEDYDPHSTLFDRAVETLRELGRGAESTGAAWLLMRFEAQLLNEFGYSPVLDACVTCGDTKAAKTEKITFSVAAGGLLCTACGNSHRDRQAFSAAGVSALNDLMQPGDRWRKLRNDVTQREVRRLLGQYLTYVLGRRPKMLAYLERLPNDPLTLPSPPASGERVG